jgi:hypothetical protein
MGQNRATTSPPAVEFSVLSFQCSDQRVPYCQDLGSYARGFVASPYDPDSYGNSFLQPNGKIGQTITSGFDTASGFVTGPGAGATIKGGATALGATPGENDFFNSITEALPFNFDDANDGSGADNTNYPLSSIQSMTPQQMGWLERVANYSPWNDVFSIESQETSLVIDIPFENRYLFIPWALGYAWVDGNGFLNRINPIQHPYYPWMRAARIAHIGVRYCGSKLFTQDWDAVGNTAGNSTATTGTARYKLARFTIGFANYPWNFIEDSELVGSAAGAEWCRNTYWQENPTAQMLAAEGGASTLGYPVSLPNTWNADHLYYPAATIGPPPQPGNNFRAAFGTVVPQIRYVLHWKWVPYDYLYSNRIPANLMASVMKLNLGTAFGCFPEGTLLFEPPKITKYVFPIRTAGLVSYLCDVELPFVYMDPPQGLTNASTSVGYGIRGHNLTPNRGDNLWYPSYRSVGTDPVTKMPIYGTDIYSTGLFSYTAWQNMFVQPAGA